MRKNILIALISLTLVGCNDIEVAKEKDNYLAFKEALLKQTEFTDEEEINFDIEVSVDRINNEEVTYRAIIDNPKENMYDIQAIIVHDYQTDDIFPSIGIFDDKINLLVDNEKVKGISLVGYIQTIKDVKDLNLELKVYIEYTNEKNEQVKVYYKTTK